MAGTLEFKSNGKAIAIEFTEQQLSPHAGSAVFWGWLHRLDWRQRLAAALPHRLPISNNKLLPLENALAFMQGLLCDAQADARRVSAARSARAGTLGHHARRQSVGADALLSGVHFGGRQPARVSSALALVSGSAAQPEGRQE